MSRIQIIGAPFSSYVWLVRMALEEKRVPYDLTPAPMHSPEVLRKLTRKTKFPHPINLKGRPPGG